VKPAAAALFGTQRSGSFIKDASASSAGNASGALNNSNVEIWGWGCNARGQLGPLAPSGAAVLRPQRLQTLPVGARLDSIG
jgi:hypothetical protein